MKAFSVHDSIVEDYKNYLRSFTLIKDKRIRDEVDQAFNKGMFLQEALIQFNPSFQLGASLSDLEKEKIIHGDLKLIFGAYNLYHHQVEAIRKGVRKESFIVTSGTGSGKSLTFLASIFNRILNGQQKNGVKAIIVYPMNALINSQEEEIKKYEINYLKSFVAGWTEEDEKDKSLDAVIDALHLRTDKRFPITYGKYTGQENDEVREKMKDTKPDIILTNYMMLELIMTRNREKWLRDSMAEHLEFLVFDELHTYRGRQGSDVSILIRRIKNNCKNELVCIGTSATMASEGSADEKKQAVADVARQIFSYGFSKEDIIGETLNTCTKYPGSVPGGNLLSAALHKRILATGSPVDFENHILAIWLENRIALQRLDNNFLERGEPKTLTEISGQLMADTSESVEVCRKAILDLLQWAEALNIEGSKQIPRKSYLPFKIHQFISQTGNVYVTLDGKDKRNITLETGRYMRLNGDDLPIYPVLFSRYSGYDFVCVRKQDGKLIPRNPDDVPPRITRDELKGDKETKRSRKELNEEDFPGGYIIIPDENEAVWSEEDEEFLPENWYNTKKTGGKFDNFFEYRLPRKIYFNTQGEYSHENKYPHSGWYIPAPLLLDPTSGLIFDLKTKENTKLMRLGNEGRSTATTITSFSVIKSLHDHGVASKNQKLLSFTDNRQDASLQSGHFNDFLMLGRLRSAIFHALNDSPNKQLNIDTICDKVYETLKLKEEEYARYPSSDPSWPDPENEKAIKDYILLRIFYDLKRGWRYNTPNLEQCALLEIDYNRLDEFCNRADFFNEIEVLDTLQPTERKSILLQILNFFRTSYAFEHYKILDKKAETEERLKNRLDESKLWSLDADEKIDTPYVLIPHSVGETNFRIYTASIGPQSYLGKYIRRIFRDNNRKGIKGDELEKYIDTLCKILVRGHFLTTELVRGKKGEVQGYRLRIDQVIWKLGDQKNVTPDQVRVASIKPVQAQPNSFFQQFYTQDFLQFDRTIVGREHTGQLDNETRIIREELFRSGKISSLFCSPTMELGIDISELNVVHMRNVPPNPANYAQRSGRAGRSGQAALVFTYCSNGSPHDRNYFRNSKKMVAGAVVPPKIDLTNEELIESHFNAYILMELGLKDLHISAQDVLNVSQFPELPLKNDLKVHIEDQVNIYAQSWANNFKRLTNSIPGIGNTSWFNEDWLLLRAKSFLKRFDVCFDRWRILYRAANKLVDSARAVLDDPTIGNDNPRKNEAKREHNIGMRQRDLLLNALKKSFGNESEFYVFRYMAAEGFLPGYNFTRLPVRAFLGYRHMDKGEFVSRPRFVAIKEFGPNNLIYHNGGKFRINRMQLTQADNEKQTIKVSRKTGYAFLNDESKGVNNDPITHEELKGQDSVLIYKNLLELNESDAKPQERISCEEEERMSTGFDIDQYFSFAKGIENTKRIVLKNGGHPLLQIFYDQSARLIQVNKRWKASRNEDGFAIGKVSGKWKRAKEVENSSPDDPPVNVRLYTTGSADILYIQPIRELQLSEDGVVSLAFALKRGIERKFQIEENEVGVWIMGQGDHKNILVYEAAEGSLGILSQMVESASILKETLEEAYRVLHFDPRTQEDLKPHEPKASYDNLLSYYNQRHHDALDRYSIKKSLELLMSCEIDHQTNGRSLDEQYEFLMNTYDLNSATEKPFIQYLYKNGIALPDRAQFNVPGCYVNADFVYKTENGYTLVFCDGSVHDDPTVKEDDSHKRQSCRDAGFDVIEWHYRESIEDLVARRKDIFRKIR